MSVGGDEVAGGAGGGRYLRSHQGGQQRQVVLGLVDGVGRILRRRPAQSSGTAPIGAVGERLEAGQLPLDGAQDLQPVEGRDARPGLLGVDA
jgi:hypothetical protein